MQDNIAIDIHHLKDAIFNTRLIAIRPEKAELEGVVSQKKIELASPEIVKRYVEDLRQFIDSSEVMERKSFIKSFVKEIRVTENEGRIRYTFPIPPDNHEEEGLEVLPTVYDGRPLWTRTADPPDVIGML